MFSVGCISCHIIGYTADRARMVRPLQQVAVRLISAHLEQLEQTVRFPINPHTMALPSGIYTIKNVKYRNWAMLFDPNIGEVVAGSSARANVGEKVRTLEM